MLTNPLHLCRGFFVLKKTFLPFFMRLILFFALSVSFFGPHFSFGQARTFTARTRIPPVPTAPKAVVVLLPYGAKRMKALTGADNSYQRETAIADLEEVRKRMMADFRDNYKYGPYYFLPDSVDVLSENNDWSRQLMDKNGTPAQDLVIDPADTNFMFSYYTYREREKVRVNTIQQGKGISYENGGLMAIYKVWVLTDRSLNPYPEKLDRRRRYTLSLFKGANPRRIYYYESSLFDINYRASALKLWESLYEFLGPPPTN
jgi:hypothetical protein